MRRPSTTTGVAIEVTKSFGVRREKAGQSAWRIDPSTSARRDEGADILGETGATETHAGDEEAGIDPWIEPEPFVHLVVGDAERIAQICEFVRKCDLGGEERVRGVLDRLRRLHVRREDRAFRGPVEALQDPGGLRSVGPEDDPVRSEDILQGPALAKHFRTHPRLTAADPLLPRALVHPGSVSFS